MITLKNQWLLLMWLTGYTYALADDTTLHDKKIKLYTFYTPSHEILLKDWFLPSVNQFNEYDVVVRKYEQECPTGEFMSSGWTKTTHHKVELVVDAIKENWGSIFIYSDIDIQFFSTTRNEIMQSLGDKDLVFQRDTPGEKGVAIACTGFFACRANEKTLALWEAVGKYMTDYALSDQRSLNDLLKQAVFDDIDWDFLPNTFFGAGTLNGKRWWLPGRALYLPEDIKIHHANWTVGIENKIEQLTYVKMCVLSQRARKLKSSRNSSKSKRAEKKGSQR